MYVIKLMSTHFAPMKSALTVADCVIVMLNTIDSISACGDSSEYILPILDFDRFEIGMQKAKPNPNLRLKENQYF